MLLIKQMKKKILKIGVKFNKFNKGIYNFYY